MGTIYDESGGRYKVNKVNGNYLLPCLTIGSTGKNEIGMWGQRHKRYLKSHHRMLYYNLLTSEKLKAGNMMLWVRKMNNICNRTTEIVNEQVIYR